ncbi:flagellar hook assembly protein FlgD [Tranquillimonas alkanivorans]|uniref:Basal-body rod modification protein FlgD n=1 Tax=Tranquillimonas alkanivorans TaxID=441119 RepID=A0A1I5S573_9RHOB|nr:flagellar hook assembly protein FlgD [Tranquillimonas alkanivorans]SFP65928.1 flagellar basal-body rod modification protein FlgD [Tranquillimonas alkanivorans]
MAIDSTITTATGSAAAGTSRAQNSMNTLGADYDSFLKLLTAQVANQDPLEPMDSTTFVSQLAQLSQVEQSIVTNSNLEDIATRLASAQALAGVQLIGREVAVPSDRIELVDGAAEFSFELSGEAESVELRILSEDGTEVQTIDDLPVSAGERHAVAWDGTDRSGLPVPDGTFRVEVVAQDAEGEPVSYTGYSRARVETLSFSDGQPTLVLSNGDETNAALIERVF